MNAPPLVFVSATSGDLRSVRKLVSQALLTIGCHPVEQSHFGPDYREVRKMLGDRIAECQALIHIVGFRYGAEPDPARLPQGAERRSYTQLEYDLGRELQRKRGDGRFRVYTFVCPEGFPFDAEPEAEDDEKRGLQSAHRRAILGGEILYETPADPAGLEARIHVLREEARRLRVEHERHRGTMLAVGLAIVLALAGIGGGVYWYLPRHVERTVAETIDPAMIGERLRTEIRARFERDAEAARSEGKHWGALRELEKGRDAALARVDDVVATIREGLAGNPDPIFKEASRILEKEGGESALQYLESHKAEALAGIDRAATQEESALNNLKKKLQPLLLQADLLETKQDRAGALALLRTVADKAPGWWEARLRLGDSLYFMALYAEAEPHLRAALALAMDEKDRAVASNDLAQLLKATNRLVEAEPLMRRALAIDEQSYGPEHPDVARDLNNLAQLLQATNRLAEAEPLMRRVVKIFEKSYGPEHPNVATALNNLASLLQDTNRLAEVEPLMRRALAIDENSYGPEHPKVAAALNNLAQLLQATNRLAEAEPLMRRALAIDEQSYGPEHPNVATDLNNLALLLQDTNRLAEAEPLMRRALAIDEKSYGPEHPNVAIRLNNLALLLKATNRLAEAEPLMRRALVIFLLFTRATGHEHPGLRKVFGNYRQLLLAQHLPAPQIQTRLAEAATAAGYGAAEWATVQAAWK
ncbi:Tetratricopeptide repeat-containing protein [Methylomagnum ishizawai]|uniref:Tetratricopeptide repeat-containing protein n=1 Tax=Methylomagnum ishizawai TaxID=1760988 RepID=A0A1Y6D907_9GAMM|nr:tetratricopeptide repeat protein [Methylomagnum ishizawai]SMF96704.1 Tetratricopeptide repeat-containing protein [Methylomagnum ishizawai]